MWRRRTTVSRGQAMVELALVLPLFLMLLFGIIVLGIGVFYQQQITNAAREAARYASIHSATSRCPTVPRLPYDPATQPNTYTRCDRPEEGWPFMTPHARGHVFGLPAAAVRISACWSGYRMGGGTGTFDAPPPGTYDIGGTPLVVSNTDSVFAQCKIDGADPTTNIGAIGCRANMPTTDEASAISESESRIVANTVTAYACYVWQPPLAGFLLIPSDVTLKAVITEPIQRQQ